MLVDEKYQGAIEVIKTIHLYKKPPDSMLLKEKETFNSHVERYHVIRKIYFGRICTIFTVFSNKFRWAKSIYDVIFAVCIALTYFREVTSHLHYEFQIVSSTGFPGIDLML